MLLLGSLYPFGSERNEAYKRINRNGSPPDLTSCAPNFRENPSVLKNSFDASLLTQIEHQNTDFGGFWPDMGSSIGAPATSSTA
jgi:hypothetical protein